MKFASESPTHHIFLLLAPPPVMPSFRYYKSSTWVVGLYKSLLDELACGATVSMCGPRFILLHPFIRLCHQFSATCLISKSQIFTSLPLNSSYAVNVRTQLALAHSNEVLSRRWSPFCFWRWKFAHLCSQHPFNIFRMNSAELDNPFNWYEFTVSDPQTEVLHIEGRPKSCCHTLHRILCYVSRK